MVGKKRVFFVRNRETKERLDSQHAHTLTHEELAILNAKAVEEPDKAKIKWAKVKWVRKRRRTDFRRKTKKHPGTAEARFILKKLGRSLTICEACGLHSKKLSIHHIDHNPHNNNPSNLQVLCKPCHAKSHHVADYLGVVEWYYGTKPDDNEEALDVK